MLVVILVGVVGGGTYLALRVFMLHRLDQQVKAAALQNADYFNNCLQNNPVPTPNGLLCQGESPVSLQREWITLLHEDGSQMGHVRGHNIKSITLSGDERTELVSSLGVAQSVTIDGTQLRVMAEQTPGGPIVVTGLEISDVSRVLSHLLGLELII